MATHADPAGLRVTVQRSHRHLSRQDAEVKRILQEAPPQDLQQLSRCARQLEIQSQVLQSARVDFDGLLQQYESLTVDETDAALIQERDAWGDLLFSTLGTVTESAVLVREWKESYSNQGSAPGGAANVADQSNVSETSVLTESVTRLVEVMERREQGQQDRQSHESTSRLPKMDIAKFDGDILEWTPFWNRFESSIDSRQRMPDVEKMNYLIGYLDGEALAAVKALPLTSDNYKVAVDLLKKRFGDSKMIIAKLYRNLHDMKPVPNDAKSLQKFVAEIDCVLGSLGALGQSTSDTNFVTIILSKLRRSTVIQLELAKDVDTDWTVELVRDTLSNYVVRLERSSQVCASESGSKGGFTGDSLLAGGDKRKKGQKAPPGSPNGSKLSCYFCEGPHFANDCQKYPDSQSRFEKIKGSRCFNCLSPDHKKSACRSSVPCRHCKMVKSHHSALCHKRFGKKGDGGALIADEDDNGDDKAEDPETKGEAGLLAADEEVLLQTASIPLRDASQKLKYQTIRVLMDPGSNRSYCSQGLADKLSLKTSDGPVLYVNRFGSKRPVEIPTKQGKLSLRKLDGSSAQIEVSVIPNICGQLNRAPVRLKSLSRLKDSVKLADSLPQDRQSGPVDLLIGSDYYCEFLTGQKMEVSEGLFLIGSDFGWILSGRVSRHRQDSYGMTMCGFSAYSSEGLADICADLPGDPVAGKGPAMNDFWSLETLGIKENPCETDDEKAIQDFKDHVKLENDRYEVSLPWNENVIDLQSDYMLSLGRLRSLIRKLRDDKYLRDTYSETLKGQMDKGVIEPVQPMKDRESNVHYIPHHAVVKPERETTKVRVVFDGSAKTKKDCPSLNECLYRGPTLLEDLVGMLMRFRFHSIAVIADIEKAFLQISIREEDRDYTRFLWLKDPNVWEVDGNIQEYRFARVPFGLNCSPSLLAQTVEHHLEQDGSPTAQQILRDLYVDNVITGVESVEEAKDFYVKSKEIFRRAAMNLRSWSANSAEFMKWISGDDDLKLKTVKVLGMKWTIAEDNLSAQGAKTERLSNVKTKRDLLSALATVFDPLGLFCPCVVRGKRLLQDVTKDKKSWDSTLPQEVLDEWSKEMSSLASIGTVPIPRKVPRVGSHLLLAFTDASNFSFATTVYLRTSHQGKVTVTLMFAKSRLNPAKKLSVPRLELMGVLIGKRALKFVEKQLKLPIQEKVLFCDSKVALAWVRNPRGSDVFVRNRVKEIQSAENVWARYVQTENNPADWATKGKRPDELDSFWWNGPSWVSEEKDLWPTWDYDPFLIETNDQSTKGGNISFVANADISYPFDIQITNYSSLSKVLRITAWCSRFVTNLRSEAKLGTNLTAGEIQAARKLWDLSVQDNSFKKIKMSVAAGQRHEMDHLGIFMDDEGILRAKGRMSHSQFEWSVKFPKLMPKDDPYTVLLVWAAHAKCGHGSVNHTLCQLRLEYWVPKGRALVQKTIRKCVTCRKASGAAYGTPRMPELPYSRVTPQAAFVNTGLDYFGPVKVGSHGKVVKCWVALFTCLCTRAVHLELVMDLSASEFLLALKRFVSRRGQPKTILCDNAPQFKLVGRATEIVWQKSINDAEVAGFCANEGITWRYIPENAPYMGGIYERMVGIVKTCLRKTIGQAMLSVKHLETFLCECEATVNSRPLVHVGGEVLPHGVLTPGHFLSLNPKIVTADRVCDPGENLQGPTALSLLREWKKGQNLLNEFWKLWSSDYLNALRERSQYRHKHKSRSPESPSIGDVVLVKEQGTPRGAWRMGRITHLNESSDGQIRSVQVRLTNGHELRRPVSLLIPLEVSSPSPSSQGRNSVDQNGLNNDSETDSGRNSPEL